MARKRRPALAKRKTAAQKKRAQAAGTARTPKTAKATPAKAAPTRKALTVAVVGAGTMGHGVAQVAALAGCRVLLHDAVPSALETALRRIRANLRRGIELRKVAKRDAQAALQRIEPVRLADAARGADVIIECVPEDLELKRNLFRELDGLSRPGALLASNTSSIRIGSLAEATQHPHRVVGLHFFNPAHIMTLVEVVKGPQTSQYAVETALHFVRQLGKTPVLVDDAPGFASTRLGVLLGLEAMRMVEEGIASPQDIDTAMELGYRHPMGPLKLSDLIGLDVRLAIAEYLHRELNLEHFRPPEILRRLVRQGRLGKKTGLGFYRWDETGKPQPAPT